MKKEYTNPIIQVVKIQQRYEILKGSLNSVNTSGLDDDLQLNNNGGNLDDAW